MTEYHTRDLAGKDPPALSCYKHGFIREKIMSENTSVTANVSTDDLDNPYADYEKIVSVGRLSCRLSRSPSGRFRFAFGQTGHDDRFHVNIPLFVDVQKDGIDAIKPMHENFSLLNGLETLLTSVRDELVSETKVAMEQNAGKVRSAPVPTVRHSGKTDRDRAMGKAAAPTEKSKSYSHPRSK